MSMHILLTGASGYIGGSVLARLLDHTNSDQFQISVLVRSQEKAIKLSSLGLKAIVGSYSNLGLLTQLASEADVVFACADADDLDATKAILDGLHWRYRKTGNVSSLIHTSGTGVLVDKAGGMYSSDAIYSDLDVAKLEALPLTQPHRIVDVTIVEADEKGYVKAYIILPSTIYGIASGTIVNLGVQNAHSQQIPRLIQVSLDRRQGGMVGDGKNIWPNVHIDDVADLYLLLFDSALSPAALSGPGHGRTGYYFGENGEHTMYDVGSEIAHVLFDMGKGHTETPTPFTVGEMRRYFPGGTSLGTNSRCRAQRSRSIGWEPAKETSDMLASIKPEVDAWIRKHGSG